MDLATVTTIGLFVFGTIFTIIGFFIKSAYNDTRKDIELLFKAGQVHAEELGRLKGKIELVEQESRLKYQAIQEQTQLEIKSLAKNVSDLSEAVRQFVLKK